MFNKVFEEGNSLSCIIQHEQVTSLATWLLPRFPWAVFTPVFRVEGSRHCITLSLTVVFLIDIDVDMFESNTDMRLV